MYITELARKNFSPFFTACRVKQVLSLGTIEKISINPVDIIVVQMQMYANIVLSKKHCQLFSYRKSDTGGNERDDYNLLGIILYFC